MVHLVLSNFPFDFFDPRDYSSQPPIQLAEILSEFSGWRDSSKKCVKITNQIKSNNFGHGKKEKNKSSQYGGFDSRC